MWGLHASLQPHLISPLLFSSVLSRDTNPNPSSSISPVAAATEGELVDLDAEAVDLIAPLIVSL